MELGAKVSNIQKMKFFDLVVYFLLEHTCKIYRTL